MAKDKKHENIDVTEVDFFLSDLGAFDEQIEKNEDLYNQLHGLLNVSTGNSAYMGGVRNAAELGRTLASIRSTGIEAVNKRFQAKRSLADMEQKKKQLDIDKDNASTLETARLMLQAIHEEDRARLTQGIISTQKKEFVDTSALDRRVDEALNTGGINLTRNDKAMKHAHRGVTFKYDAEQAEFVAFSKDGQIIDDYPKERIPYKKVIKAEDGVAVCDNGDKIIIIDGDK